MKWALAALAALLIMPGCQGSWGSGGVKDPLFGRTRIEPPRTGTAAGLLPANPSLSNPTLPSPPGPLAGTSQAPASVNLGWSPPSSQDAGAMLPVPSQGGSSSEQPGAVLGDQTPPTQPLSSPSEVSGDRLSIPFAAMAIAEPPQQLRTSGALDNPLRSTTQVANEPAGRAAPGVVAGPGGSEPSGGSYRGSSSPYPGGLGMNRLAGRERVIQVIEPSGRGSPNPLRHAPRPIDPASPQAPAVSPPPTESRVNITDLPESGKSPSGR